MLPLDPRKRAADAAPATPSDLILSCHAKIRAFVAIGDRLSSAEGAPDAQIVEAARGLRRYFGEALPLHEADEEESVAPRLRASSAGAEAEDALASMVADHMAIGVVLAQLDPIWSRLAEAPGDHASVRATLIEAQEALAALFVAHLDAEERDIIPLVARVLPAAEQDAIASEIRARRASKVMSGAR